MPKGYNATTKLGREFQVSINAEDSNKSKSNQSGGNKMQTVKRFTKADNGKLSKVLEYESGARVEIPINKDGSVKWFDDSKLLKPNRK